LRSRFSSSSLRTCSRRSDICRRADLEELQSRALIAAPDQEWEVRDIDEEMADDGSTDESNREDYGDTSDAAGSKVGGRPRSRKRVRRTKESLLFEERADALNIMSSS
jgi:hypothetical protein